MADRKGVTTEGFAYELAPDLEDDMELLEDLRAVEQDKDVYKLTDVLVKIFGKEQKDALYDFYREYDGKVKISRMVEIIKDCFTKEGAPEELKN